LKKDEMHELLGSNESSESDSDCDDIPDENNGNFYGNTDKQATTNPTVATA